MNNQDIFNLVKQYLRIDFKEDDLMLSSLILFAEEYLENAIGYKVTYEKELEKLAVTLLVSHFYDNRGIISDRIVYQVPRSIESILRQLEYSAGEEDE